MLVLQDQQEARDIPSPGSLANTSQVMPLSIIRTASRKPRLPPLRANTFGGILSTRSVLSLALAHPTTINILHKHNTISRTAAIAVIIISTIILTVMGVAAIALL